MAMPISSSLAPMAARDRCYRRGTADGCAHPDEYSQPVGNAEPLPQGDACDEREQYNN